MVTSTGGQQKYLRGNMAEAAGNHLTDLTNGSSGKDSKPPVRKSGHRTGGAERVLARRTTPGEKKMIVIGEGRKKQRKAG